MDADDHPGKVRFAVQQSHSMKPLPVLAACAFLISQQPLLAGYMFDAGSGDGQFLSVSGDIAAIGYHYEDTLAGKVSVYRNIQTPGYVLAGATLVASDRVAEDYLGFSVAASGNSVLAGAYFTNRRSGQKGRAYLFRDVHTATGTVTENAILVSSGSGTEYLGYATSLNGSVGILGAPLWSEYGNDEYQGTAYVYRGLDTATGTITPQLRLRPAVQTKFHFFGHSVTQSGNAALVGCPTRLFPMGVGSAHYYRNISTATGVISENTKLVPSNGLLQRFGWSVALSGSNAVVGAPFAQLGEEGLGAAYLFRNLDSAGASITEAAVLTASDLGSVVSNDTFGHSVALSGDHALVAAQGSKKAYLFLDLSQASGTVTETIQFSFPYSTNPGMAVSMDGNALLISAAYPVATTIDALTTLDGGNTRGVDQVNFTTTRDWVIGSATGGNEISLGTYGSATLVKPQGTVQIGRDFGADGNILDLRGALTAAKLNVGSHRGNSGNLLKFRSDARIPSIDALFLAPGNSIHFAGNIPDAAAFFEWLGSVPLRTFSRGRAQIITPENHSEFLYFHYDNSSREMTVTAIAEGSGLIVEAPDGSPLDLHGDGLSFEDAAAGSGTSMLTPVMRNAGNTPLTITGISFGGDPAGPFSVQAGTLPVTLAPGEKLPLTLSFSPASTGPSQVQLQILSNDTYIPEFSIPLSGNGTDILEQPAPPPPPTLNTETGLPEQSVSISNLGSTAVGGTTLRIDGVPEGVAVVGGTYVAGSNAMGGKAAKSAGGYWLVSYPGIIAAGANTSFVIQYRYTAEPVAFTPSVSISPPPPPGGPDPDFANAIDSLQTALTTGNVALELATVPGRSYKILYSENLKDWHPAVERILSRGESLRWTDDGAATTTAPSASKPRFYRVQDITGMAPASP